MGQTHQQVSAAEFKSNCLKLIDSVQRERTEIVITERGQPVAKLVPYGEKTPSVFGYMAGTGSIVGDILSPLDIDWNAENE
jgi:prevent-host-death family protein